MKRKRSAALGWVLALLATILLAGWQRYSGPTRPLAGTTTLGGVRFRYALARSHAGPGDGEVRIPMVAEGTAGLLSFRRSGSGDPWTSVAFTPAGTEMAAALPHQPPAGKLDYKVMLRLDQELVWLNGARAVTMRFTGPVPLWLLVPHVGCMFLGFLFAARAGLAAAAGEEARIPVLAAFGFLTLGGLILGPVVQKLALGEFWTGWPAGPDLTDNKTALAWLGWGLAVWRRGPRWVLAAALLTLTVFAIPHSWLSGNVAR